MVKNYSKADITKGLDKFIDDINKAKKIFKSKDANQSELNKAANILIKSNRYFKHGRLNFKKNKF